MAPLLATPLPPARSSLFPIGFVVVAITTLLAPLVYAGGLYGAPILLPMLFGLATRGGRSVRIVATALAGYLSLSTGWYIAWFLSLGEPNPALLWAVRLALASLVMAGFGIMLRPSQPQPVAPSAQD